MYKIRVKGTNNYIPAPTSGACGIPGRWEYVEESKAKIWDNERQIKMFMFFHYTNGKVPDTFELIHNGNVIPFPQV